jgi:hypothetical protein
MQAVYIYYVISMKLVLYNTFLKEMLTYLFGMILNFCVPVWLFFYVWYLPTHGSFAQCHTATQTCFFLLFIC